RAISGDGVTGDWLPLGTLVRLPTFTDLRCPRALSKPCLLSGNNLFLAASFAATQDSQNPTEVPYDFTGTEISVPHPANGNLYLHLRDDAGTTQVLTMQVLPLIPATPMLAAGPGASGAEAAKEAARPATTSSADPPAAPAPANDAAAAKPTAAQLQQSKP
ncbi:MAG: hypothetical protein KGL64_05345, partial [Acidobacteriota bacterium]|nr:hypothetical protein [Acidobacteriota bacterium]